MSNSSKPNTTAESPEQAIQQILDELKIRQDFPEDCLSEAEQWLASPGLDDSALLDLRALPFVTIDNPDSRDLDQALLIENTPDDGYRVYYALADAAYYVRPGSALFNEALLRGVTYYTPIKAVSMLPPTLSEGLISLNPQTDRRTLVFNMHLNKAGDVTSCTIQRAVIHSQAKLSYAGVQAFLNAARAGKAHDYQQQPFGNSLRLLKIVGKLLMKRAAERDVVSYNRVELDLSVNEQGTFDMAQRHRVTTEQYNEQISLLCNMQGALLLSHLRKQNSDVQAIFRIHDEPLDSSLNELRSRLDAYATLCQLPPLWRWKPEQSLADYIEGLPRSREHAGRVKAIQRQVLISNRASQFQDEPGRHHALAAASYARFSSPMREMVGIFTHKELLEALTAESPSDNQLGPYPQPDDEQLRQQVIDLANESKQTQKRLNKAIEFLALQQVLSADLADLATPSHRGTIMGFKSNRLYVACDDIACDLKLARSDLESQYDTTYDFSDLQATPENPDQPLWRMGDTVNVFTRSYNAEKRRFVLGLLPV